MKLQVAPRDIPRPDDEPGRGEDIHPVEGRIQDLSEKSAARILQQQNRLKASPLFSFYFYAVAI